MGISAHCRSCKAYEMMEGTCYTAPFRPCQAAAPGCRPRGLRPRCEHVVQNLQLRPKNGTCALVHDYVATEPCAGPWRRLPPPWLRRRPARSWCGRWRRPRRHRCGHLRTFPRPDTESNTSWTQDDDIDIIVQTPSRTTPPSTLPSCWPTSTGPKTSTCTTTSAPLATGRTGVDPYITYCTWPTPSNPTPPIRRSGVADARAGGRLTARYTHGAPRCRRACKCDHTELNHQS